MEKNFFWIGGKHAVLFAHQNKKRKCSQIILSNRNNLELFKDKNKIKIENNTSINKLFNEPNFNHQGFAALINTMPQESLNSFFHDINKKELSFVILNNLQDDRNIGSIIRTCVAFNIDGIIVKKRDFRSRSYQMFKSASGGMEFIKIFEVSNLSNAIKILHDNNVWVYALDAKSKKNIFDYNFNSRSAFVFGSEGFGINDLIKKNCDEILKISISDKIQSLNVSNAVSSVLTIYNFKQKKTA